MRMMSVLSALTFFALHCSSAYAQQERIQVFSDKEKNVVQTVVVNPATKEREIAQLQLKGLGLGVAGAVVFTLSSLVDSQYQPALEVVSLSMAGAAVGIAAYCGYQQEMAQVKINRDQALNQKK